jgi:hypothetical protein
MLRLALLFRQGFLGEPELPSYPDCPDRYDTCAERSGSLHGLHHESDLHPLISVPTHHKTRVPIQDCHQVHPASSQANVRDISTLDMIGRVGCHSGEQRGKDGCLLRSLAEMRAGIKHDQSHFLHIVGHRVLID